MMDPDRYAETQAAALRDDWQFSRIFAPPHARPGFTALLALRAELQNVLAQANEPAIAAMKLEWWRAEIGRGFAGDAQHPLARALGTHLSAAGSAAEYCLELVDATETELEPGATFTEQDFQLYLYRSGGVLAEQLAVVSGASGRAVLDAARRLGQLKRFSDLVLAMGAMIRAGHWLFPAAWLTAGNSTPSGLLGNEESAQALLRHVRERLDIERVTLRTALENVQLPAAVRLQWSLAQKDYVVLRDQPQRVLAATPPKGNPLARLWTAWRGARQSM